MAHGVVLGSEWFCRWVLTYTARSNSIRFDIALPLPCIIRGGYHKIRILQEGL